MEVRRRRRGGQRPDLLRLTKSNDIGAALPGYTRVDLRTSYNITKNFQIYGLVENLFDRRYGLFGTYFNKSLMRWRCVGRPEHLSIPQRPNNLAGHAVRGLRRCEDHVLKLTHDAASHRRTDCQGPPHPREEGLCL